MPLAVAARIGSRPKRSAASLLRPIAVLFAVNAVCALIAGIIGWILASNGVVYLVDPIAKQLPPDRHVPYLADLWAHNASYIIGFFGGLVVIAWVWYARGRAAVN